MYGTLSAMLNWYVPVPANKKQEYTWPQKKNSSRTFFFFINFKLTCMHVHVFITCTTMDIHDIGEALGGHKTESRNFLIDFHETFTHQGGHLKKK